MLSQAQDRLKNPCLLFSGFVQASLSELRPTRQASGYALKATPDTPFLRGVKRFEYPLAYSKGLMKNHIPMKNRIILFCATLGGIGYFPKAPGTYGSFVGLLIPIYLEPYISLKAYSLGLSLGIFLAIGCCHVAERLMGHKDPSAVVLDEAIAMPLCFWGVQSFGPKGLFWLLGFALFRFFDIWKPLGIKKLQYLPGGLGIVVDDLAAALCVNACLRVLGCIF